MLFINKLHFCGDINMEEKDRIKILHITTHMGGGVGKVISDLAVHDTQYTHSILLLEEPEKKQFIDKCYQAGIEVKVNSSQTETVCALNNSDVVILHWWHHPLMCKFLYHFPKCSIRLILWSHVSGCTYPFLSYDFCTKFHKIFFTSQCSFQNKYWNTLQRKEIAEKAILVYGLGQLSLLKKKQDYQTKNPVVVGYIGTLTKSKLHPEFVNICYEILQKNPQIKFVLIGDKKAGQWIESQSRQRGIEKQVELRGYCENINDCLLEFDIFGYPLNPYHFGTTENSILEAMAAALPVVLINQLTEQYIIENGFDGLLSDDLEKYKENILTLAKHDTLRKYLGENASTNVHKKFDFETNKQTFIKAVTEVMQLKTKAICFQDIVGATPFEWFTCGMHIDDKTFFQHFIYETNAAQKKEQKTKCPEIFLEQTKSSVTHFSSVYPKDKTLKFLRESLL